MPLPNDAILLGASRWLHELRDGNEQHAYEVLKAAPEYAGLTPTQYMNALAWLHSTALIDDETTRQLPDDQLRLAVLEAALTHDLPLWLVDADQTINSPDELPADVESASEVLGLESWQCLQAIRNVHGKVNLEERNRLGALGELALMELLNEGGDGKPIHVAASSDSHGYDILWAGNHEVAAIEVKTTSRRGRLTVHVSRHEYEVSRYEPGWCLVVVFVSDDQHMRAAATLSTDWIHANAPSDTSPNSRWESAALSPPATALSPGLPITPVPGTEAAEMITTGRIDPTQLPVWWGDSPR